MIDVKIDRILPYTCTEEDKLRLDYDLAPDRG